MLLELFQRVRKVVLTAARFFPARSGALEPWPALLGGGAGGGGAAGRGWRMLLPLLPLLPLLLPALAEGHRAAVLRMGLRGSPRGEVSPAFLSLTLDASLARDPRYVALLR